MSDQATTRLAEIRERADAEFVTDPESCASGLGQDLMQARVDRAALLSLAEQLQGQIAEVREIHTMERRYTYEHGERSYDTRQEAADALGITPGAAEYLDVCSHCGSIEMDSGAEDYRDSLWPCATAKALGVPGDH